MLSPKRPHGRPHDRSESDLKMSISWTPWSFRGTVDVNGNIPFTLALDVAHNRPVPYHLPLLNGFVPGYEVVVVGQVQHGADRFHINLESSTQDVIFHFNPRFHDGVIVRNSQFNGAWGPEERGGGLQMRPGQEFRINIVAEHDGYRVYVNGAFFTLYRHRQGHSLVHQLLIDGNVSIRQLVYYSTLLGIGYPLRSDCNIALQHSLPPGSEITLVGTPQSHLDRFSVNLESAGGAEKALHFNPRFNDGVVVRNSFLNGGWGPEERDGGLPLRKGAKFTLNIRCDPDGYRGGVVVIYRNLKFDFFDSRNTYFGKGNDLFAQKIYSRIQQRITKPLLMGDVFDQLFIT
uniref:Galectin n=1 Tax=Timema monikensis TaxID=170555 RepID=A0A7R9E1J3_9NEOP|nr:unnamed protein product [Timema monikensis]